jgi:hypothetical protein
MQCKRQQSRRRNDEDSARRYELEKRVQLVRSRANDERTSSTVGTVRLLLSSRGSDLYVPVVSPNYVTTTYNQVRRYLLYAVTTVQYSTVQYSTVQYVPNDYTVLPAHCFDTIQLHTDYSTVSSTYVLTVVEGRLRSQSFVILVIFRFHKKRLTSVLFFTLSKLGKFNK